MPRDNQPDPAREFGYHVCAVCAVTLLALALEAAHPGDPLPLAVLGIAAATRWTEAHYNDKSWEVEVSSVILDAGLGLMAADIIASWS